jgi:hypothetical protein
MRPKRRRLASWGVFKPGNDMEASRPIGRGFLVVAMGLLVSSAHEADERSDRFGIVNAAFDIVRLVFSRVPVSDQNLRPREGRPDSTQQELELRRGYGADRDEDHGIGWGVGLSLGGRANSGQPAERRAAGSNAEIEADRFGNQLRRSQIQDSPPGNDEHRPGNRARLSTKNQTRSPPFRPCWNASTWRARWSRSMPSAAIPPSPNRSSMPRATTFWPSRTTSRRCMPTSKAISTRSPCDEVERFETLGLAQIEIRSTSSRFRAGDRRAACAGRGTTAPMDTKSADNGWRSRRPAGGDSKVLLRLDPALVDLTRPEVHPQPYYGWPLAWTRSCGAGRASTRHLATRGAGGRPGSSASCATPRDGRREDGPTCSCQPRTASEVSPSRVLGTPGAPTSLNYRGPSPLPVASAAMLSSSAANLACIAAGKALKSASKS